MKKMPNKGQFESSTNEGDTRQAAGSKYSGANNWAHSVSKRLQTGLKLLPNAKDFLIDLGDDDALFREIGLKIKGKPRLRFKQGKNDRLNRHVVRQYERMDRNRKEPRVFWAIAGGLMASPAYQVMFLNKCLPNWYRELPYGRVLKVMGGVRAMVAERDTRLIYHRVYIPKGDTYRPLGVPNLEWRIYLGMYANILRFFLRDKIPKSQHGYMTGRGVITAGQEIIEKVIPSENIYEFDLQQFFPNVNTFEVQNVLTLEESIPLGEAGFIQKLCMQLPVLPEEKKLDESEVELLKMWAQIRGEYHKASEWPKGYTEEGMNSAKSKQIRALWAPSTWDPAYGELKETGDYTALMLDPEVKENYRGIPQGTAISPILSILTLIRPLGTVRNVMYADDGILWGPDIKEETILQLEEGGAELVVNREKSGGIKRKGNGTTNLRFLGMEYNPGDNTFSAHTRTGARLEFSDDVKFIMWLRSEKSREIKHPYLNPKEGFRYDMLLKEFYQEYSDKGTWSDMFKSKFIGYIFSRLQGDEWNPDIQQDFQMRFQQGSGMDMAGPGFIRRKCIQEDLTIFNGSTFALSCLHGDLQRRSAYSNHKDILAGLQYVNKKIRNRFRGLFKKIRLVGRK